MYSLLSLGVCVNGLCTATLLFAALTRRLLPLATHTKIDFLKITEAEMHQKHQNVGIGDAASK
jgi:hypothetical protein